MGKIVIGETTSSLVVKEDKSTLWHNRMGHISNKGLQILNNHGPFNEDQVDDIQFCESCIIGKQQRVSFATDTHK